MQANASNPTSINLIVNHKLRGLNTTLFSQSPVAFYSPIKKAQRTVKGEKCRVKKIYLFHLTAAHVGIKAVQRDFQYSFVTS